MYKNFLIFNRKFSRSRISNVILLSFLSPIILLSNPLKSSFLLDSPKEIIDQAWQIVYRDFLDPSGKFSKKDWIKVRKKLLSQKYFDSNEAHDAIRQMLLELNDPYTKFLDPKQLNEMRIDTSGELSGVGIQISINKESGDLIVVSPIEGSPAFEAGVQAKDKIISIDNIPTKGIGIEKAVQMIRGKKGTKVRLGILRGQEFKKITLIRNKIKIKSVYSKINSHNNYGYKIGYIRLKTFNAQASREMKDTLIRFEDANVLGYVLDLRGNPGGLLESSIEISRQWINKGVIVSTLTKEGIKNSRKANGTAITEKPLILLINGGSASASEIVSGAIRDNKRGLLVGEKTFGKGLVQSMRTLSDGSGLTVTVAKYLTPSGIDINKNGIKPDILAEARFGRKEKFSLSDFGTIKDNQYMVAENQLIKILQKDISINKFDPKTKNITFALSK
tara:strand:- start:18021 stop:19361 length:1341 start_codon:yes stop_codon:yes gene_type:complete